MSKYFVVVKNNDEYNDEIYTVHDGGQPVKVGISREVAQKYADQLNWENFSGLAIYDYCYGLEDILACSVEDLSSILRGVFPTAEWDLDELVLPEMTLEQYKLIAPCFDLEFYSVKEIDS